MTIDEKDAPPLHCGCGASFKDAGDFIKHFGKCWGHGGEKKPKPKAKAPLSPEEKAERKRLKNWNAGKAKVVRDA